jgi:CBS domain-containing protein
MNVREIMASVVQRVRPEDSLYRAARIMREYDIGCVLVCDGSELAGIVTDRDLVRRGLADPARLSGSIVADVMTRNPVCCGIDDTVKQVAAIMAAHRVRRLPVLDFNAQLRGIVSIGDVCVHASHEVAGALIGEVSRSAHTCLAETA